MEIETERLILALFVKGIETNSVSLEFSILGDADTMSFYQRPYTKEEVIGIIAKNIETFETSGYGMFAVTDKATGEFLGDCGITIQVMLYDQ